MGKKVFTPDGETVKADVVYPYKNMGARKWVLFLGFLMCAAGFALVLCALLMLFIPSLSYKGTNMSPLQFYIYLYSIGVALDFVGIVFTVAGANTKKGLARFSFFLGSVSFIAGVIMLLISLLFKNVLPLDALKRMTDGAFMLFIR